MKKLMLLLLAASLVFTGCKKEEDDDDNKEQKQTVSLTSAQELTPVHFAVPTTKKIPRYELSSELRDLYDKVRNQSGTSGSRATQNRTTSSSSSCNEIAKKLLETRYEKSGEDTYKLSYEADFTACMQENNSSYYFNLTSVKASYLSDQMKFEDEWGTPYNPAGKRMGDIPGNIKILSQVSRQSTVAELDMHYPNKRKAVVYSFTTINHPNDFNAPCVSAQPVQCQWTQAGRTEMEGEETIYDYETAKTYTYSKDGSGDSFQGTIHFQVNDWTGTLSYDSYWNYPVYTATNGVETIRDQWLSVTSSSRSLRNLTNFENSGSVRPNLDLNTIMQEAIKRPPTATDRF